MLAGRGRCKEILAGRLAGLLVAGGVSAVSGGSDVKCEVAVVVA